MKTELLINFCAITAVGILTTISPGPNFAVVLKNSLHLGRKSGIRTSLGIGLAGLCRTTISLICIGMLFSQSTQQVLDILRWFGGSYLAYLGIKSIYQSTLPKNADISFNSNPSRQGFLQGFLCSILNPKSWLSFFIIFSSMFPPDCSRVYQCCCGVWIILINALWFICVACFFTLPKVQNKIKGIQIWFERITGSVLILLGIALLKTKLVA